MTRYCSLFLAAVTALLTSCGTAIHMVESIPAKCDAGHGAGIVINCPGKPQLMAATTNRANDIRLAFSRRILSDGYYHVLLSPPANSAAPWAALMVSNVKDKPLYEFSSHKKHAGGAQPNPDHELHADVEVYKNGTLAFSHTYRIKVHHVADPVMERLHDSYNKAFEMLADEVMSDLTPHEHEYTMWIEGSDANPSVEQGAAACSAGDWVSGEALAKQAISVNPHDPEAYYLLGIIELHKKNYSQSTHFFEKANALRPDYKYSSAISDNKKKQRNDLEVQHQLSGN